MGLGLGYALAGLGQGLEQGIGSYLAQKRYEKEIAMQQRAADDAHLSSVLGNVVNYGYRPDGAPDDPTTSAPSPSAPASTPGMVGSMLGQASNGPAANTPSIGATSVFGQQRTGLAGPGALVASAPAPAQPGSDRVSIPGVGSIDPTNSMFGIKRMLAIADARKAMGEATHQEMVNAVGPAGIDGTPEHSAYVVHLEEQKALATLPIQLRLKVAEGQISLGNALQLAGTQHGYRTQEITQEGNVRQTLQSNQQNFEKGMIPLKANAELYANERGRLFGAQLTPTGIALQHAGKLPQIDATDPFTSSGGPSLPGLNPKADAWESYRAQGMTPEQATARVNQDFGGAP